MPSMVRMFGAAAGIGMATAGLRGTEVGNAVVPLVPEGDVPHLSFPPHLIAGRVPGTGQFRKLSPSDPFTPTPTPGSANAVDPDGATAVLAPLGAATLALGAWACGRACRRRVRAGQDNRPGEQRAAVANGADSTAASGVHVLSPNVDQPLLVHVERPANRSADEMHDCALPHGIDPTALGLPVRDTYVPHIVEQGPSEALSWELAKLQREPWRVDDTREPQGFTFVKQSEGCASVGQPLASVGFTTCSAFLIMNVDAKDGDPKWLMFHHDSGYRSTWTQAGSGTRAGPVSPCSTTRGFIGRPRVGYDEFQKIPGRKWVLLIESASSCDRREQLASLESDNVRILRPLTMRTVERSDGSVVSSWSVVYRPRSDELIIHFRNLDVEKVMHFKDVFSGADLREAELAQRDGRRDDSHGKSGDIVARMREYRSLLLRPGAVSEVAREAIELCLKVVELRHVDVPAACMQLRCVLDLAAVRDERVRKACTELKPILEKLADKRDVVDRWLKSDLLSKGSEVIQGLTQLVEQLVAMEPQAPRPT